MSNDPNRRKPKGPQPGNDDENRKARRIVMLIVAALIATLLINSLYTTISNAYLTEITYTEFKELLASDQISEVEFQSDDRIVILTKDQAEKPKSQQRLYYTGLIPNQDTTALTNQLEAANVKYNRELPEEVSPIVSFLVSWVLPVMFMYALFSLLMRGMTKKMGGGLGGIGESKAKVYMEKQTGVTFADVAGQDEAKESLVEIIDFLHNPQKYTAIGAKLPKGALLVGSPGTGKTLIQRFLLDIYRRKNRGAKIICCAPTGRAARRMEQSTGFPATTIHKALGLLAGEDGDYCEPEMLDADLIVVDEVSMMDIYLANHLFRSVPHGSQLVLIGDADQLPSVGPGAVLSEIIACGAVPVVRLDRIFRQSYGSRIAANAKLIRHGNLSLEYGEDFQFYDSCDMSASAQQIETLYLQETARYGVDNVALLTPYRQKTETGVNALNERLREKLNPQDGKKPEVAYRKRIYRLGDKVMQIKNCEDISNGDIGYITSVTRDDTDSVLTVDFGDGRIAEYDGSDLEMLDLAYASTIHKSQGSEYKSVIINLQCAHAVMLVRPLVYTAITRAKERVLIVGERRALCIAIKRTDTEQRGTMLSARIKELISNVKGDHYNGNLAQ